MARVLVDSSVWTDYFRRPKSSCAPALIKLVQSDEAWITDLIRVELLSGTRSETEYRMLEDRLTSIPLLPEPNDYWNRVALARFRLARHGVQTALVDVSIAVMAHAYGCFLWSLDKQFQPMAKILRVRLYTQKI